MRLDRPKATETSAPAPSDWRSRVIVGERLGAQERFPAWLEASYRTLREQVIDDAYPCFFGTQAEKRGEMFYAFVRGKDTAPLAASMRTFAELAKQPAYEKNNLAVFFEPDREPLSHRQYRDLFWRTLQELHEADQDPHADAQPDPSDPVWEFCYAGVEMFVVCACPSFRRRHSRNLGPGMVLLFQPRSVFVDKITNKVIGRRAREQVRQRLRRWDELAAHPDLGFYGEPGNLEWKQYFLPDDNQPHVDACPFLRRQARQAQSRQDPLTPAQQSLWLAWRMEPESAAYNVSASMRLDGPLDAGAARRALEALVRRHAILRASFREVAGEPRQCVEADRAALDWADDDLQGREDAEAALRERLRGRANRPFDLAAPGLLRATLVRLAPAHHVLQLCAHHIVADGWAFALLRKEWLACYEAELQGRAPRLPGAPMAFGEYAAQTALTGTALERQLDYWRERLRGAPPLLALPLDRPRPPRRRSEAGRASRSLTPALHARVRALAAQRGTTPFVLLLGVYAMLLAQQSGQADLCIGVPLSRRRSGLENKLVGYLVNTVAIRLQLDAAATFGALLDQAGRRLDEAQQHGDVGFGQLLDALKLTRDPAYTPLCQVLINQLRALPDQTCGELRVSAHAEDIGRGHYDLCLHVAFDRREGRLYLDYASALFEPASAERLLDAYLELLETFTAADAPQAPLPQAASAQAAARAWWRAQFARADEPARLLENLGAARRSEAGWQAWEQPLGAFAARPGRRPEVLLHGAWAWWLASAGYRRQAVFGSAPRGTDLALPLWIDMPASSAVGAWLRGLETQLDALDRHRPASPGTWQAWTETEEALAFDSAIADAAWSPAAERPSPALVLSMRAADPAHLLWRWDGSRVDTAAVHRVTAEVLGIMQMLANADEAQPLAALAPAAAVASPADAEAAPFVSVIERIAIQARRRPQAEAVSDGQRRLDYRGLDRWSAQIAARLAALGAGAESRVGVCMARSCGLVAALLGVLKAGAAYVPLDPSHPAERLAEIAADAGLAAVVVDAAAEQLLASLGLGCPAIAAAEAADEEASFEPRRVDPEQLAYVIYTSGSTGRPKGVAVSHRNVARLFDATAAHYRFGENDVWPLFHAYAFDVSVWEWLGALSHGGRLVVVPAEVARDARAFHRLLRAERVSVLNQTPSAFLPLMQVDLAAAERLDALRVIVFAGEKLEPGALARWCAERERAGLALPRIVNMYGITETTVHVTYRAFATHELHAPAPRSLIGEPMDDLRLHLLDRAGRPTPAGGLGELYVAGPGVARGYLGRAALTAERFLPDPYGPPGSRMYASGDLARRLADGELEYLGRSDLQVKIRGYRVEPGELQAALYSHPAVREAAALAMPGAAGQGLQLAAYVTPKAVDTAALREHLARRLPAYLLPAAVIALDALPLTVNGKLDRRALPAAAAANDAPAAASATERALARAWADVLAIAPPAADADFFALGGHSLLALRAMSRLHELTGREAPLELLFEHPRLDRLAAALDAHWAGAADQEGPALVRRGEREAPLSFAQERLWILWKLEPDSSAYHVAGTLQCEGPLDAAAVRTAFATLVARHEALRTRFVERDGVPRQRVLDVGSPETGFRWRHDKLAAGRRAALAQLQALAREPFDLERDPPLRASLLELAPERHLLQLVLHHIVSDGWSIEVLLREFAAAYRAARRGQAPALPALPIQYADYAAWQRERCSERSRAHRAQLEYWRAYLDGLEGELELPTEHDRSRPYARRGGATAVRIPAELAARAEAAARAQGATLFMLLLAAFDVLLYRYSGAADVAVAVPWAGRDRRETEGLIGFFVNTLILRTRLSGAQSFAELLAKVRADSIAAQAHRELPFDRLVAELNPPRKAWNHPYAQVKFLLQDAIDTGHDLDGLRCRLLEAEPGEVRFELALDVTRDADGLDCRFSYAAEVYDDAFMAGFARHYAELLAQAVAQPQGRVGAFLLSEQAEGAAASVRDDAGIFPDQADAASGRFTNA